MDNLETIKYICKNLPKRYTTIFVDIEDFLEISDFLEKKNGVLVCYQNNSIKLYGISVLSTVAIPRNHFKLVLDNRKAITLPIACNVIERLSKLEVFI